MSCPSYLDGFRDGKSVAAQLLLWGCCFQDGCCFNMTRTILLQFLYHSRTILLQFFLNTLSQCPCAIHIVESTRPLLGKKCFLAVHAFLCRLLMLFSVHKTLLPRLLSLSTDFSEPPFRVKMSSFLLKHMYFVLFALQPSKIYPDSYSNYTAGS